MVGNPPRKAFAVDDLNFVGWTLEKSITVIKDGPRTRVLVKGRPYMSWPSGDEGSVRMAIVQLSDCGLGTQEELSSRSMSIRCSVT